MIKLSTIKVNPDNPRIIKDDKFRKLVKSIEEFPKMMKLRPIIVDGNNIVLGGNMRLKALQELKYKEIPDEWVKQANELTEDEKKRFIIADNVSFGEHDWEVLSNEWNVEDLEAWGVDLPVFNNEKLIAKTEQLKDFARSHVLISYHPDNHDKIQKLLEELNELSNVEIELASN